MRPVFDTKGEFDVKVILASEKSFNIVRSIETNFHKTIKYQVPL